MAKHCHDGFVMPGTLPARLVVRSIEETDEMLEALSDHAVTSTAVVKSA